MYLIVGIAAAAAASVLLYNHYRDSRPNLASSSTRRAQQLAAVVLVLAQAVEGVLDALNYGVRTQPLPSGVSPGPRRLVDLWDDEDDLR